MSIKISITIFCTTEHPFKATPCVEVWQTSNLRRLRLGEESKKERRRKRKPQDENIMVCPIPYGDHNKQDKNIISASATQGGHNECY